MTDTPISTIQKTNYSMEIPAANAVLDRLLADKHQNEKYADDIHKFFTEYDRLKVLIIDYIRNVIIESIMNTKTVTFDVYVDEYICTILEQETTNEWKSKITMYTPYDNGEDLCWDMIVKEIVPQFIEKGYEITPIDDVYKFEFNIKY